MDSSPLLISVVIVNFNSGDHLPRCLDSLYAQTWEHFELIVVDNHSTDGSLSHLSNYSGVTQIRNETNRGFAAGQNQGISAARGSFVLALNYDLVMAPTFLAELVMALEACPSAGWACGKLLNMGTDGTRLNTIYAVGHELSPNRFSLLRGQGEKDCGQYDEREFVFGAPGAAALYRREFIDDISINGQFFDETLFTWYEDVDVDWRGQKCGWQCLYVPTAIAHHIGHMQETYTEPFRSWRTKLTIRNRWLIIAANESWRGLWDHAWPLTKYEISNLMFVVRTGQFGAYIRACFEWMKLLPYIRAKRRWMTSHRKRGLVVDG